MISGVHVAIKVGALLLDTSDGAPQHPLPAAAVVGVRMEEPHGSLPPPPAVDRTNAKSRNYGSDERSDDHHRQHRVTAQMLNPKSIT